MLSWIGSGGGRPVISTDEYCPITSGIGALPPVSKETRLHRCSIAKRAAPSPSSVQIQANTHQIHS
jgi:hypothetical protein